MKDLWTLKYRPQDLGDFVGNEKAISIMQHLVSSGKLPHLVVHGPAGSGKASAVFALARGIYGDNFEHNFTYFNASDFFDQGKRYLVRDKRFVRLLGTDDPKKIRSSVISIFKDLVNEYASMGSIDADYKIIFVDSAESLNESAQHALRRIMERYSRTCRFIFSTTQPSRLISPLRSRGLQLFFTYVSDEELVGFLGDVADSESLAYDREALGGLARHCKGNVDCALRLLQSAALQHAGEKLSADIIFEVVMEDVPAGISSLQEAISAADFPLARKAIDKMLIEEGMSGVEIVRHLYRIVNDTGESPAILARILLKIADADLNVRSSANDRIHLERLVTEMANV